MRAGATRLATVVLILTALACSSVPLPPARGRKTLPDPPSEPLAAWVVCESSQSDFAQPCDLAQADFATSIAAGPWLKPLDPLEHQPSDADVVVTITAPVRRPYWSTPAHNPAFALLSAAIPLWWSEPHGFSFRISDPDANHESTSDATWEGTNVLWGFATLLNISRSRVFYLDPAVEQRFLNEHVGEALQALR